MRTITLRRSLVALFAAAISFGAITQAQAETLRIGYQKYGTLVLLKAKGSLEKRLAEQGIEVQWTEFPGGPQLLHEGGVDGPVGVAQPLDEHQRRTVVREHRDADVGPLGARPDVDEHAALGTGDRGIRVLGGDISGIGHARQRRPTRGCRGPRLDSRGGMPWAGLPQPAPAPLRCG